MEQMARRRRQSSVEYWSWTALLFRDHLFGVMLQELDSGDARSHLAVAMLQHGSGQHGGAGHLGVLRCKDSWRQVALPGCA